MEKRGLRFFILHTLAHQLQNWADFVSRMAGDQERPVQQHQSDMEYADVGSSNHLYHVVSPLLSNMESADPDNPPSHWAARVSANEPPAHWLALVQKGAPDLLKQIRYSSRNVQAQSPRQLSANQSDSNIQTTDARTEQQTSEVIQTEKSTTRLAETDTKTDEENLSEVGILREDYPVKGMEGTVHREEADLLTSPQSVIAPSSPLPAHSSARNVDTAFEQSTSIDRAIAMEEDTSSTFIETGKLPAEDATADLAETDLPALTDLVTKQNKVERTEWDKWPALSSKPHVNTQSSSGKWPDLPIKVNAPQWEKGQGGMHNTSQQNVHNLRLPVSALGPTREQRSPKQDEVNQQTEPELRWPSLPDEVAIENRDWEMARRVWERQQRLNEEQRGSSWNA